MSVQRNGAMAYDRETGVLRWQIQFSESALDALHHEGVEKIVSVGPTLVCIINHQSILVFSSQDGHRIGGFAWDSEPLCIGEYDGKAWLCGRHGNSMIVEMRDPVALGAMAINDKILGLSDRDAAFFDGASIVAHTRTAVVRYDLATRKTHKFPLLGDAYNLREFPDSPGYQVAFVHGEGDRWISAVLDKEDKVLFSEPTVVGGGWMENRIIWDYQLHGNSLLRFDLVRKNCEGVLCKSFPDGKELWRTKGRLWNMRHDDALVVLGSHAFAIAFDYEGGAYCHAIELATGRETGVVRVPGWQDERAIPAIAIEGGLLYGTQQGLVRLIPVAPEADEPANGAANLARAVPIDVALAPGPMTIDGHLDDWKGVEAHELLDPRDARSGGGAPTPTHLNGSIRLCYDGEGVYAAVRVDDRDTPQPPPWGLHCRRRQCPPRHRPARCAPGTSQASWCWTPQ